ncbi:hypothetical protein M0R45_028499 [Rubus argutus]|uniref:Uncharacterized protein n=1 Tax=Rubus argutus TaxID=59490 RepID=A0AAW1W7H9_RUBAR
MESRRTNPRLSNFMNISVIGRSKIRIKFSNPKLLVKTMQKPVDHHRGEYNNNKNKKKKSARKVSSVFTNPFTKHKSPEKSSSSKPNGTSKLRLPKARLPLLSFLTRKKSLKKLMKSETDATGVDGVGKQESSGQLVPAPNSKLILTNPRKWSVARSIIRRACNMKTRGGEYGEDSKQADSRKASEDELCKKRILMGGKCRPLSSSGTLHYDQNGILLTDDVLP